MCKKVPELSESKEKAAKAAFLSFCLFALSFNDGLNCRAGIDYGEYG